jgi:Fe-S-cluster containining protein
MTERRELLAALRNLYAVIDAEAAAIEPPRADAGNACTYVGDGFEPQPYQLEVDLIRWHMRNQPAWPPEARMGDNCPLLDGKQCSVYDARPFSCRVPRTQKLKLKREAWRRQIETLCSEYAGACDIPFRRYPLTLHFLATRPGPAEVMDAT